MKIWNTHVHVYVYIFCVTVSKISILLLQVALQSQFIIHCYTILIYLIPGLKSLLYIGRLLAVWQVNVKEEKLIVKEVIKKKKERKEGGGF